MLLAEGALGIWFITGIRVPTDAFVAIAGATELLFGLLVISGALPQVAMLVAGIPFNGTLLLFVDILPAPKGTDGIDADALDAAVCRWLLGVAALDNDRFLAVAQLSLVREVWRCWARHERLRRLCTS